MSDRLPRVCGCGCDLDELEVECRDCGRESDEAYYRAINPCEPDRPTFKKPIPRWGRPSSEPRHAGPAGPG